MEPKKAPKFISEATQDASSTVSFRIPPRSVERPLSRMGTAGEDQPPTQPELNETTDAEVDVFFGECEAGGGGRGVCKRGHIYPKMRLGTVSIRAPYGSGFFRLLVSVAVRIRIQIHFFLYSCGYPFLFFLCFRIICCRMENCYQCLSKVCFIWEWILSVSVDKPLMLFSALWQRKFLGHVVPER